VKIFVDIEYVLESMK